MSRELHMCYLNLYAARLETHPILYVASFPSFKSFYRMFASINKTIGCNYTSVNGQNVISIRISYFQSIKINKSKVKVKSLILVETRLENRNSSIWDFHENSFFFNLEN